MKRVLRWFAGGCALLLALLSAGGPTAAGAQEMEGGWCRSCPWEYDWSGEETGICWNARCRGGYCCVVVAP